MSSSLRGKKIGQVASDELNSTIWIERCAEKLTFWGVVKYEIVRRATYGI